MAAITQQQIQLNGQCVDFRVVHSATAKGFRVRVGLNGVEVVHPVERMNEEMCSFINSNADWILGQLQRVGRFHNIRRPEHQNIGEILFQGQPTQVRALLTSSRSHGNIVDFNNNEIVIHCGTSSQTPLVRSLEYWLRKQARFEINKHLDIITARLGYEPNKVYVMGQRTKWGNCSTRRNLSFNWRLILAPDFVLRYIITHEVVHLAIPDHSNRFWLTVQSHCKDVERAKQWLRVNGKKIYDPLPTPTPFNKT